MNLQKDRARSYLPATRYFAWAWMESGGNGNLQVLLVLLNLGVTLKTTIRMRHNSMTPIVHMCIVMDNPVGSGQH